MTRLPASNINVPEGSYTISALNTMQGMEGTAFTATLRSSRKIAATLHQDGNGGQTFVDWTTRQDEADFDAYAAGYEGKWGKTEFSPEGFDWDTESVLEALVGEVILFRELKRRARTSILFLTSEDSDPTMSYRQIKGATADDPRIERIMAKYAPEYTAIWRNNCWEGRP